MVNYSKWDAIDAGSDDEVPDDAPAADIARQHLSEWIQAACPAISERDSAQLIDFVSVSLPRIGHSDNMPRAAEIVAHLEQHSPSRAVLLDVLWWCRAKDEDATDAAKRQRTMRLRSALFGALNTLEGAATFGSARQLFDALQDAEVCFRTAEMSPNPLRPLSVCRKCA